MRAIIPAGAIALLAFLVAPKPLQDPLPDPMRDLRLALTPGDKLDWIEPGEKPWVRLHLANISRRFSYPIVRPGDGSEEGWREPHVYFTATLMRADGSIVDVPKRRYGRCGMFDGNWPRDAFLLKPGERLELENYVETLLEFQEPGRVQLRSHYTYGARENSRTEIAPNHIGLMKGVPPFELVSEPVEFEVRRMFDVRIKVKRPMKADVKHRLSEILDVEVMNRSSETQHLASASGYPYATVQLELDAEFGGWRPSFFTSKTSQDLDYFSGTCRGVPSELQSQATVSLIDPDRLEGTWEYPKAQTVKLRAAFRPGIGDSRRRRYYSPWVEITVEK